MNIVFILVIIWLVVSLISDSDRYNKEWGRDGYRMSSGKSHKTREELMEEQEQSRKEFIARYPDYDPDAEHKLGVPGLDPTNYAGYTFKRKKDNR